MNDDGVAAFSDLIGRRADFLTYLRDQRAAKRDVVDDLDHSRSTVDRAIDDLVSAGLVRREDGVFETTAAGVLALEEHRQHTERLTALRGARTALAPLSADTPLSPAVLADADVTRVDGPLPYGALEPVRSALASATRVRALLPNVADSRFVQRYRARVAAGADVSLVLDSDLLTTLTEQFPGACRAMADSEAFEALEGSVPSFGLVLAEDGERTTVSLVVYTAAGSVHAVLHATSETAVEWAESLYAETAATATPVTETFRELAADDTGAVSETTPAVDADVPPSRSSLVAEDAGFVELSADYFDRRAARDPVDAWRTGLDLSDVAAGYAVDRTRSADADATDDRLSLTEHLLDGLREGVDHAVVGPPGAGKSTVCKAVAHEWYDRDLGPVLYRESGRFDPVDSTAELRSVLEQRSGRVLVVVEDAVRGEANAVLQLARDLNGDDDVTFLFDARESEWTDSDELPVDARLDAYRSETVRTVEVPTLDEREVERFVDRFESIAGLRVPVEPAELLSTVRRDARATTRGEVLLVFHRLAGYATGPVTAEVPTALLDDVRRVYREFAVDGPPHGRTVSVLVALLNAAGVGVHPEYVHALADTPSDHEAIERRLDGLSGAVVFPTDTENPLAPLETIHEAWSEQFLRHLLDEESQRRAHGVVADCLTALLSLADDPDRRDAVTDYFEGERDRLDAVEADPAGWTEQTVESVYGLVRRTPGLAPLFGVTEHSRVDLPESCPERVELDCISWRGKAYVSAGEFERAATEFETLADRAVAADLSATRCRELRADAHRNRGRVAMELRNLDRADTHLETALELYEALDDRAGVADTLRTRSSVERFRGSFDEATALAERAAAIYRDRGDEQRAADCRQQMGVIATDRGEHDRARSELETALAAYDADDEADRRRAAKCHVSLGMIERNVGNFEAALDHDRQARELYRDQGDRHGIADTTHNIGETYRRRGDLEAARSALEDALEHYRAIDDGHGVATSLNNLGLVAQERENLEHAAERFTAALEHESNSERHALHARLNLGALRRETGDLAAARERLTTGVERARDLDARRALGVALVELGRVDLADGDAERAVERIAEGVEVCEAVEDVPHAVEGYRWLVEAHDRAGNDDAALEACRAGVELADSLDADLGAGAEWLRERRPDLETPSPTDTTTD